MNSNRLQWVLKKTTFEDPEVFRAAIHLGTVFPGHRFCSLTSLLAGPQWGACDDRAGARATAHLVEGAVWKKWVGRL